jgi:hypothetical protein
MKKVAIILYSFLAISSMLLISVAPVLAARTLSGTALAAPTSQYNLEFGFHVATDGKYVVVAAPSEEVDTFTNAGKVYIYVTADLTDTPITLTSQTPSEFGGFGGAVAVGGGYVVVAATGETVNGVWGAGKVYIYDTADLTDTPITILNPETANAEYFGMAVATDGKYIVVGTNRYYANEGDFDGVGRAYLYDMAGTLVDTIESPTVAGANFGASVAIDNRYIVVSASQENYDDVVEAGSVYVYTTDGTEVTYANTLHSSNYETWGQFGSSVAVDGKFIVVGAQWEDVTVRKNPSAYARAGRAYVFTTFGRLIMTLNSPNAEIGGEFGNSVAIGGNVIVVSAHNEDVLSGATTYINAGRVYVYGAGGPLTLVSANLANGISFGQQVAVAAGYVVVGSPFENVLMNDDGRAYVFKP